MAQLEVPVFRLSSVSSTDQKIEAWEGVGVPSRVTQCFSGLSREGASISLI